MIIDYENQDLQKYITRAEFGLERESLRVSADGSLAQTPHPFGGSAKIDRDFCENQIEIISDVFSSPEELGRQLNSIQNEIYRELGRRGELLWPFSNPPEISGEDEIPVARFEGELKGKSVYREYLAKKYGKRKMLFSGIHLNFSFSPELLSAMHAAFDKSADFQDFKNSLYLRLAKRMTEYGWLIVYLTSASPVTDPSLGVESNRYSSARCGAEGYWNFFVPLIDCSSLDKYADSIEGYISAGSLKSASELYYPVRLKPRGANSLDSLRQNGVNHIELRMLDVNPLSRTGIFSEDIRFIHLLALYLLQLPDPDFDSGKQLRAIDDIKSAAQFGNAEIKERARAVLRSMESFCQGAFGGFSRALEYQKKKLGPGGSYAERVSAMFSEDYVKKGLELARRYARGEEYV